MDVGASSRAAPTATFLQRLSHLLVAAAVGSLVVTATVLWGRRLAGAFEQPVAPSVVLASGLILMGLALLLRIPVVCSSDDRPAWGTPTALYGTSVALLLVASLLTSPNRQPWWSWLLLWTGVVTAEALIYWRTSQHTPAWDGEAQPLVQPTRFDEATDAMELPDHVLQRFERADDAELGEIISGQLRARFSAGQRLGSVHLSFCPPFAQTPLVVAESISGPSASVKPALIVPNGARIDIRLDEPAAVQTDVIVEVFVQSKLNR
jgi:hypothetical protein